MGNYDTMRQDNPDKDDYDALELRKKLTTQIVDQARMECAGAAALALDLARIAQIDDHDFILSHAALRKTFDGFSRIDGLDLGVGLRHHQLQLR
mgnify:CR=1 FL=1